MRKRLFQSVLAISLSAALVLSPIAGTASFAQTENLGESSVAEVREDYISTPGDVTPGAVDQVEINKTNFPDANFRQYVKDAIDTDGNGVLSSSEIGACTYIDCSDMEISSLKGIEIFYNLETLSCERNALTSLDVSQNTALTWLSCDDNALTSLDVSQNTALTWLSCDDNALTSLDVSQNTALEYLDCYNNALTSLDVSKNTGLTTLWCTSNALTGLDVSQNTGLTDLYCEGNQLTSLDVSKNTGLTDLYCEWNQLTSLDVSKNTGLTDLNCYNNALTDLDVSQNTALEYLNCSKNALTSLDVSKNTGLTELYCYDNALTDLDVSQNTGLTDLYCEWNQLTSLDVSKNTGLTDLYCYYNALTDLDVSQNTALEYLDCSENALTSLDVSKNTGLTDLYCYYNAITSLDVRKNTALEHLNCSYNAITSLDVSQNTGLTDLDCGGNALTSLDVSQNTGLTDLDCGGNALTSLDVSQNTGLEYLDCSRNALTSLDVSQNTALIDLDCSENELTSLITNSAALEHLDCSYNAITSLDVSQNTGLTDLDCYNNALTDLDVSKNTGLTELRCYNNALTSLDVSKNTGLTELRCSYNAITSLDVSKNTGLTELRCYNNAITSLDVSKNTGLTDLYCYDNAITSLDVSQNTALTDLDCGGNALTSLDVSQNTALEYLDCYNNALTSLDVSQNTALIALRCYGNHINSVDISKNTKLYHFVLLNTPAVKIPVKVASGIQVSWEKSFGADGYYVYRRIKGGSWTKIVEVKGVDTLSYIDKTVTTSNTYDYTIRGYYKHYKYVETGNPIEVTELSNYDKNGKSITIGSSALATPKITAVSNEATGVKISWGKVTGAAKYRVYYKTGSGSWVRITDTTSTSYTWTGAKSGMKYTFTVRCLSSDGKSFTSNYDKTGKTLTYVATPKLSGVSNEATGVKISWGKVTGAAKYRVYYKTGSGSWVRITDTTSTSYTWTGAKSGTKYTFTVRCLSSDGKSFTSGYDKTGKTLTYVATPKLSGVSNVNGGVKISWGKVTGAAKYRVYCKKGSGSWTSLADTTATSYTWAGAKSGTKYTFTVRCISSDGKSITSGYDRTGKSITTTAALGKPTVNTPTKVSNGVKVSWSKVSGANSYYVYRRTKGGSWSRLAVVNGGSTVSYTDTTVKAGTTYEYTVRAYNGKTLGDYDKNGKGITIPASTTSIGKPAVNTLTKVSNGVKVSWSKVSGANSYYVYRRTKGGSWSRLAVVNGGSTVSYTDTSVKAGTTYDYTVRAYNGKALGDYDKTGKSITIPASTTSALGKPTVNTPTKVLNGVKVSWSKVSGATSYYVYRRTKGGSWNRLAIVNGGSTVSYTDTSVKAGTTYDYTVRAYNGKALGDYDKTGKSITIPASTTSALGKPTVNTPTKVSSGVKVSWSKVSGANSYYVYRRTKGGSWSRIAIVNGGSTVSYTDTSVKAGTTYDYTVRAYDGKTLGDYDKKGKSITVTK